MSVKVVKKKRNKHDYVDNKKMLQVMCDWKDKYNLAIEQGVETPRVPEYIGDCIRLIAENLSRAPNFYNYSFKDEMIMDGIENVLLYIHNFNPERSKNPFSYFTQIIYYAFLRRIAKEKKQSYVKQKLLIHEFTLNQLSSDGAEQFADVSTNIDTEKYAALEELFEKKKKKKTDDTDDS